MQEKIWKSGHYKLSIQEDEQNKTVSSLQILSQQQNLLFTIWTYIIGKTTIIAKWG